MIKLLSLTLFVVVFSTLGITKPESNTYGISPMKCTPYFISAGVYNEKLGVHGLDCTAVISTKYSCRDMRYNAITHTSDCLDKTK